MKILLLAPQPFFQERGTPIAVRLAAEVIAKRPDVAVTLITYQEGTDVEIPNLTHKRVRTFPHITGVQAGFSMKKLYYDLFFLFAVISELWSARKNQYTLIHAVEESVFFAWILKPIFGVPYIYDMDSSLSLQLVDKLQFLSPLSPFFRFLEGLVIKGSKAVVPVCDALDIIARSEGAKRTLILRDISLLKDDVDVEIDIRKEADLSENVTILLYVGNLENYQGIDLMLEGYAEAMKENKTSHLIIIGGAEEHIESYKSKSEKLGISQSVSFLGPRPVSHLSAYLKQADILVSPRTLGNNTPMKIYSYIHSGIPVLATDLPTHTQVLTPEIAQLVQPTPKHFSNGLVELLDSKDKRAKIGDKAHHHAEEHYTFEVFEKRLNHLYEGLS